VNKKNETLCFLSWTNQRNRL